MRELRYKRFTSICHLVSFVNKHKIQKENVQYINIKKDGHCEILYWAKVEKN